MSQGQSAGSSDASPSPRTRSRRGPRVAVLVLLAVGVLCVLVELLSPSLVYWTGQRVVGTDDGGIVYYTVKGEQRTLDAPGAAPARPVPVVVYADPEDSTKDRIAGPAKWFDATFVLAPFVAAGLVWTVSLLRRRRREPVPA